MMPRLSVLGSTARSGAFSVPRARGWIWPPAGVAQLGWEPESLTEIYGKGPLCLQSLPHPACSCWAWPEQAVGAVPAFATLSLEACSCGKVGNKVISPTWSLALAEQHGRRSALSPTPSL